MDIRSFSPASDLAALLRLRIAIELHDQDNVNTSKSALSEQLHWPGHNPVLDRWVIEDPSKGGELVAHALIWLPPEDAERKAIANVAVLPRWRNQGLGSRLLKVVIKRAGQLGAASLSITTNALGQTGPDFLRSHGFSPAGSYTQFEALTTLRLPPVIWPVGYSMRPYSQVNDLKVLTDAMNECYAGLWGHHAVSQAQMREWLPGFTLEALFLVFSERGKAVGISRVELKAMDNSEPTPATGYIDAPGILPRHRRLDLYRALLLTGLNWLKDKDILKVALESWGDNPAVLDMYIDLGFQRCRQVTEFRLTNLGGL